MLHGSIGARPPGGDPQSVASYAGDARFDSSCNRGPVAKLGRSPGGRQRRARRTEFGGGSGPNSASRRGRAAGRGAAHPTIAAMVRVGLISDTHGLLRPAALEFLRGCDHIIHGGDIGGAQILEQLGELAPLTAVRGNNDRGAWADRIPEFEYLRLGGICVYVIHDLQAMDIDPAGAGVQVVVCGHSHDPAIGQRDGVLYVNPGSAGPRRFALPVAVGELVLSGSQASARYVELLAP